MRRRAVVVFAVLACAVGAEAQPAQRTHTIGFLGMTSPAGHARQIEALRAGLSNAGYREGANLSIEYRWAEGRLNRLPELAAELVRLRVGVIVTHGTAGSRAAKEATTTIPVVVAPVGDPVRSGLIASLSRPGGIVTGLSLQENEVTVKRLELLRQIAPGISRIGWVRGPAAQTPEAAESMDRETDAAARALALEVRRVTVRQPGELPGAFSLLGRQKVHAVIVQNTSVLTAHAATIADLAVKHRLPTVGAPLFVDAGGLLAYGPNVEDMYRRAADYVDRILKGAKPGDLPVEQPTRFELIVNLTTAKRLGLTLPPAVLSRADRAIE